MKFAVGQLVSYELVRRLRNATHGINAAGYTFHSTPNADVARVIGIDFRPPRFEVVADPEDIDGYSREVLGPVAESLKASLLSSDMVGTVPLPLPHFAFGEGHRVFDPVSGLCVLVRTNGETLRADIGLDA